MAHIIVTGFRQTYGADGKPIDWVKWVPIHSPQTMGNEDRVDHMNPENIKGRDGANQSEKVAYMTAIWKDIEPAYTAWREGREIPLNGTPLAAWPGITPEQAEIFRLTGIRTVEAVRDMTELQRAKVRLPNSRDLQELAKAFLENSDAAKAAQREAEKDRQIADMAERMAAMEAMLEQAMKPGVEPDDETEALRAECDAKGIKYHHKAGPAKLRELLSDNEQEAA
ncbi:MAG: hypothetical protein RLW68_00820 [Devosia marina]|uniref:hypothetical protein n=1 Tax=Devosia marina TaxID=2683198 RepID=UPI0032ECF581